MKCLEHEEDDRNVFKNTTFGNQEFCHKRINSTVAPNSKNKPHYLVA